MEYKFTIVGVIDAADIEEAWREIDEINDHVGMYGATFTDVEIEDLDPTRPVSQGGIGDTAGFYLPPSWDEEPCDHCKGYVGVLDCTCSPFVLRLREWRKNGGRPEEKPTNGS
jgi:hypothetical protein